MNRNPLINTSQNTLEESQKITKKEWITNEMSLIKKRRTYKNIDYRACNNTYAKNKFEENRNDIELKLKIDNNE